MFSGIEFFYKCSQGPGLVQAAVTERWPQIASKHLLTAANIKFLSSGKELLYVGLLVGL